MLEAIKILRGRSVNIELYLVGDGPLRKQLEEQASKLGIASSVQFFGSKKADEVRHMLHECDISVLPSISESMGLVNMEAMISGRPVIATDVLGVSELVEDRVTGFLCPPKDAECIANTVEYILAHPQQTQMICEAAQDRVKTEFDREICTKKLLDIWNA